MNIFVIALISLLVAVGAFASYESLNYMAPGGGQWVIGGDLDVVSGGAIDIQSGGELSYRDLAFSGAVRAGMHTVTAGEASANTAVIATGITVPTAMFLNIFRASADVKSDARGTFSGGNLTVIDGAATYNVTENDVISWLIVGY
jgi:hypothetical protein